MFGTVNEYATAWALSNALLALDQKTIAAVHPSMPFITWQKLDVQGMRISKGGVAKLAALSDSVGSHNLMN